jgi:membrane fusion protein, copper/silver efflux system
VSHHRFVVPVVAVVFAAAGVAGGLWWAQRAKPEGAHAAAAAPAAAAAQEKKVLYWHDPMVPGQRFDKPGKSPFMDMPLVPVYEDAAGGEAGVKVDARLAQNLGVRTAIAEKGRLAREVDVVGTVAFDERAVVVVQARTAAFVEELLVRAPLDPVRRGQPLARLFVPEWAGAQQEYLALKSSAVDGAAELARAARNRLLLLGMSEPQVLAVEREGKPVTRVTLTSPADGVVAELGAREGMNVMAGAMLFRINGIASVWVNLDVPEAMAAAVRPGAPLQATVPAYPGEVFKGSVSAVLPDVSAATRTIRARVQLANPGGKLKPGMFASVKIDPRVAPGAVAAGTVLVPSEAVIVTGERSVVIVDRGQGRYEPVAVKIGAEERGMTEVLAGLQGGEKVVASGQFLLDSEASLRGFERRMDAAAAAPPAKAAAAAPHQAQGTVERVQAGVATISHGPVPSLKWPSMTMEFKAAPAVAGQLKAGETIHFEFVQTDAGEFEVTGVHRMGGKP